MCSKLISLFCIGIADTLKNIDRQGIGRTVACRDCHSRAELLGGEVGEMKCLQLMVNEDNQTTGNGRSRVYEGTKIPKACVKCSTEHICFTQIGP